MLNFAVTLAAMYILPQFYQQSMLLTVGVAGMVMLPGGIVNALMSMFAGRIYDKCGVRIPARCGFLLSIVACILLMFTTPTSSLSYVVMCHILLMIGVPLAMSPCQTHALSSLPPRLSTDGSSMINTMQQVMGAIATAVATYLVSAGASASTAADASVSFAQGAHWGFVFPLVLAIVSLVMSFGFKKVPAQASEEHVGQKVESVAAEREQDGRVSVADLMEREVFSVPQDANALDALHLFASKKISGAPVVDGKGAVCGFLSDGDIIGTLARQTPKFSSFYAYTLESGGSEFAQKADELAAMDVMRIATPNVISVNVSDDMRDVCALLAQHRLKKAPVMDGARMVGIISRSDITRYTVGLYGKAE